MEKHILKSIIATQKERFLTVDKLSPRLLSLEDEAKILAKEIVVITGIRRSGKSSLLNLYYHYLTRRFKIPDTNILFVNFEDERFIDFTPNDFDVLFKAFVELYNPKGKIYFFLDEIQNVAGWERWVNRLYEFEEIKIFITGSNASLLHPELAISLTGRHRQIKNYCFSFAEYAILKKVSFEKNDLYNDKQLINLSRLLEKYLQLGGYPEALINNDTAIVDQYFKDIVYRDIIARNKLRNIREIKELAIFLISNTGNLNSYDNLRKLINATNTSTIKNYIEALEEVYLIIPLQLFDYSVKKQIYNVNKYYVSDIGFYHAVGFSFSPDQGRILENIVFIDLLRKGKDVYYWKSKKGNEVDFVVFNEKNIVSAVQVCFNLTLENMEREVKGLVSARDEIAAQQLTLVTMEQNRTIRIEQEDIDNSKNHFGANTPVSIRVVSYLNWLKEE